MPHPWHDSDLPFLGPWSSPLLPLWAQRPPLCSWGSPKTEIQDVGSNWMPPTRPPPQKTLLHKAAPLSKSHISTVTNEHLRPYLSWIHSRSSYEPLASTHRSPTHWESTPRALSLAHRYSAESGAAPSSPWHPGLPRRHFHSQGTSVA